MTIHLEVADVVFICSAIVALGGAIKVLLSVKKALTKPLDDINVKLELYDSYFANDKGHLEKIDGILEDLNESMYVLIKSQKTVLSHMRDGNHTGEIRKREEELDNFLIEGVQHDRP